MEEDKWNVVVLSSEGLMTALNGLCPIDTFVLLNIIEDCPLDISREGRNPLLEEKQNQMIVYSMFDEQTRLSIQEKALKGESPIGITQTLAYKARTVHYEEIPLSFLKTIRNDEVKLPEFILGLLKKYE